MPLFGQSPRFITPRYEPTGAELVDRQIAEIDAKLRAQARLPHGLRDLVLIDVKLDQRFHLRPSLPVPVIPGRAA